MRPPIAPPDGPAGPRGRGRWLLRGAAVAVVLAGVAVALVLTVFSKGASDSASVLRPKLAAAFAPVVDANRTLSNALSAVHGSHPSAAQRAAARAETATSSAQGALNALTSPGDQPALVSQARQALDREAGYLTAVSAALSDPTSPGVSQLPTLSSNLASAIDAVPGGIAGSSQDVSGADSLVAWAHQQAKSAQSSSAQPGRSSPSPSPSGADCGGGLHAGPNTSCPFALNVQSAYYEAGAGTVTVNVYSPVTGDTYAMDCAPAGSGVTCTGGDDASVSW